MAFLSQFRQKYGTAEDYAKNQIGLSSEDIEKIRENLLVPRTPPNSIGRVAFAVLRPISLFFVLVAVLLLKGILD